MSYRDDRDADRARIEALESELAAAQRRISDLENPHALIRAEGNALAVAEGTTSRWYGAPLRLDLTRSFPGELPREQLEDLITVIRGISRHPGHAELLRSSMTWSAGLNKATGAPLIVVSVTIRDGATHLVITDSLKTLAGSIFGGIGGGVGGGAIALPIVATLGAPMLMPFAIAAWLGGVFLASRSIFKISAKQRAARMQTLFATLCREIEERISAAARAGDHGAG